jgi:hypothetical protein
MCHFRCMKFKPRVCARRFFQFPVMFTNNMKWRSTSWLTMFNSLFSFPTFLLFSPLRLVKSNTWVQWNWHLTPERSIDLCFVRCKKCKHTRQKKITIFRGKEKTFIFTFIADRFYTRPKIMTINKYRNFASLLFNCFSIKQFKKNSPYSNVTQTESRLNNLLLPFCSYNQYLHM